MKRTRNLSKVKPKEIPGRLPDAICGSPTFNFTQIANSMLRDPQLSCKAKGLLSILLSNREGHWTSFSKGLQKFTKDKTDSIRTGLQELEKNKYLLRVNYVDCKTKRRCGSFWVYTHFQGYFDYQRHLVKLKQIGCEIQGNQNLPGTDKQQDVLQREDPIMEMPIMEMPIMANPSQIRLINNKTNNKNIKKGFFEILNLFPDEWKTNESFQDNLKDYIQHRKEKGSSLTKVASSRLVSKLKEYSIQEASEALARSVENGWTGVFPESAKSSRSTSPKGNNRKIAGPCEYGSNVKVVSQTAQRTQTAQPID